MNPANTGTQPVIGDRRLYDHFMETARNRITTRQFDPGYEVPIEHYEMILEAARHAPSGANSQPWHYIVIRDPGVKQEIADYFVAEQRFRATLKMKFPTPNYAGLATAPGFIVVVADFRYVKAFPMLKDDDSDLNKMYIENAERILLEGARAIMAETLSRAGLTVLEAADGTEAVETFRAHADEVRMVVLDRVCSMSCSIGASSFIASTGSMTTGRTS